MALAIHGAHTAMTLAVAAGGTAVALAALYLLTLALAAFRYRPPAGGAEPRHRLAVLVPAHDEARLIGRCLESLLGQRYPASLMRLAVVADNCTDGTAALVTAGGVQVLVRDEPDLRGKGRALRWAIDRLDEWAPDADAVVVVDADSVAEPGLLRALESRLAEGAAVVQAEYLVLAEPGTRSELRAAAFLLFHRTRFAGRAVLGMPCHLVGNGMLIRRDVLETVPWNAFTGTEDLEYSLDLRLAGVRPRFTAAACVRGPAPTGGRGGETQRMRWEGGRFHAMRSHLPRLLGAALRGRWSVLDAAVDLALPPLGLLVLVAAAGGVAAGALTVAGATGAVAVLPWLVAVGGLTAYVPLGLRAAGAPASTYRALLSAPRFLLAKAGTYARMTGGLGAERWQRTERPGEGSGH